MLRDQALRLVTLLSVVVALPLAAPTASAAMGDEYVTDDTFLVASVDLRTLADLASIDAAVLTMTSPALAEAWQAHSLRAAYVETIATPAAAIVERGQLTALLACGLQDVRPDFGPVLLLPLENGVSASGLIDAIPSRFGVEARSYPSTYRGRNLVVVGKPAALDRYENTVAVKRPDLSDGDPLTLSGGDAIAAILSLGGDGRRVIRELWPTLPSPLEALTGPLLADGARRLELRVTLGEEPAVSAKLETDSDATRDAFQEMAAAALAWGAEGASEPYPELALLAEPFKEALTPQPRPRALELRVTPENAALRKLMTDVAPAALRDAREAAVRNQKLSATKQIALAMHNFYDAIGHFPAPAAIVDETGKPLLSWRVALLPFLEQSALYNEFRLDEPWDSEHNRRVASAVPAVYGNPSHPTLIERGLTTWQRPAFDGSNLVEPTAQPDEMSRNRRGYFAPGETFRDLIDGTSNTVMFAEVAPEHAVFWTRPDADWRVDLDDPLAKLRTDTRKAFVTGFYDGHAEQIAFDVDPTELRKMLTKTGREVIRR